MRDLVTMKAKGLIWPLVILLGACNEKPVAEADAAKEKKAKQTSSALPQAGGEEDSAGKDGKSAARTDRAKKPAMGSVAQGQPGKAISPYSNEAVDVKGLAAGSLVQDPKFPGDESKKFVVPEGVEQEEVAKPEAKSVPGREGMVFSPFNNKIVDVRGIPAGTLVTDPTYPASEKKIFRVPAAAAAEEGDAGAEGGALIGAGAGAIIGNQGEASPEKK